MARMELSGSANAGSNGNGTRGASEETPVSLEKEMDRKYDEIYSLADVGQSTNQIARKLNRPHGEVELILALRGAKT
jgi:hypothetical protein